MPAVFLCQILGFHDFISVFKLEIFATNYCIEEQGNNLTADKCVEKCIVSITDAIIDPWTVMVKAINAAITQVTMSATRSANNFAIRTQTTSFKSL